MKTERLSLNYFNDKLRDKEHDLEKFSIDVYSSNNDYVSKDLINLFKIHICILCHNDFQIEFISKTASGLLLFLN